MKTLQAALLVLLSALVGCQSQPEAPDEPTKPVFNSPNGPVTLLDLVRNEEERTVRATIAVGGCRRRLAIGPTKDSPYPVGFCAELTDLDYSLLFRVQYAWDLEDAGCIWVKEQTQTDELTLCIKLTDERTTEEYNVNGDVLSVDYSTMDAELRRGVLADCAAGEVDNSICPEAAELSERFAEFREYYSRHIGNTLHDNADGEVLAFLINNRDFAACLVGQDLAYVQDSSIAAGPKTAERICAIATLCGMKCFFPPYIANPICVACTGVSTACASATIACWMFDCGD